MSIHQRWHTAVLAAASASLLLGLAACGDSDDTASTSGETPDEAVAIEHRFGTTELDSVPERVVSIDVQWTDAMVAMGTDPVGIGVDSYTPDGGFPWQELPADTEPLSIADGLPFEQIAELEPDLIVGTYMISDEEIYGRLTDIAPTIASPDEHEVTPWEDLVRIAGDVLADASAAEEVIESVNSQISRTADDLPGLDGQTFSLAQYVVGDSMYIVADEEDGSSVFFQQLGMTMYPPVASRGEETGDPRINVSPERADLLQADLLAFLVNGGDESDLADIPGFDQLPGTVAVLDYSTIVGLNTPSPLSIPYALDQLRPHLEAAAGS